MSILAAPTSRHRPERPVWRGPIRRPPGSHLAELESQLVSNRVAVVLAACERLSAVDMRKAPSPIRREGGNHTTRPTVGRILVMEASCFGFGCFRPTAAPEMICPASSNLAAKFLDDCPQVGGVTFKRSHKLRRARRWRLFFALLVVGRVHSFAWQNADPVP
jgi:hypothetical protein